MIEKLVAWRAEVTSELEQARRQLTDALKEQTAADQELLVARADKEAWITMVAPLKSSISHSLAVRLNSADDAFRMANSNLSTARNAVADFRYRVEDLVQALAEIETIMPKPEATEEVLAESGASPA